MRKQYILWLKFLMLFNLQVGAPRLNGQHMVLWAMFVACLPLIGCSSSGDQASALQEHAVQVGLGDAENAKGRALLDVALGQERVAITEQSNVGLVNQETMPYVGRYATKIDCEDAFVACESGEADFIISFLPNGIAHRMIKHRGSITFTSNQQYLQDHWSYDPNVHQIILHRASGVDFFYDIDAKKNIVMDLDKIAHATEVNQQYFAEGNPLPLKAYVLEKINTRSVQE